MSSGTGADAARLDKCLRMWLHARSGGGLRYTFVPVRRWLTGGNRELEPQLSVQELSDSVLPHGWTVGRNWPHVGWRFGDSGTTGCPIRSMTAGRSGPSGMHSIPPVNVPLDDLVLVRVHYRRARPNRAGET